MIAEILSTGDELRTGALEDTNAAWIARRLEAAGVTVTRHQSVGDDTEMLVSVFTEMGARADIVLATGGLGPTTDDLTAEAAGRALGKNLILDESALSGIRNFFTSRGRTMPPSNEKQALFPEGAEILENPAGTAPGFSLKIGKAYFFFMPGVPREMKRMFQEQALPRIRKLAGDDLPGHLTKTISTFGLPESATGEKVAEVIHLFPGVRLGLRARFPVIEVKLYADGKDREALLQPLDAAADWVCGQLGDRVFSVTGESMEAAVGRMLREKGKTVALAESCTGGLIATSLTDVPGSSDYFLYSGVTYSNEAKVRALGVSEETLAEYGAVSEATAGEMAEGARRLAKADYGLSTSGIAGPDGGSPEKPVGTVCIGLATPNETRTYRFILNFADRGMNKRVFAVKSLDLLRTELA